LADGQVATYVLRTGEPRLAEHVLRLQSDASPAVVGAIALQLPALRCWVLAWLQKLSAVSTMSNDGAATTDEVHAESDAPLLTDAALRLLVRSVAAHLVRFDVAVQLVFRAAGDVALHTAFAAATCAQPCLETTDELAAVGVALRVLVDCTPAAVGEHSRAGGGGSECESESESVAADGLEDCARAVLAVLVPTTAGATASSAASLVAASVASIDATLLGRLRWAHPPSPPRLPPRFLDLLKSLSTAVCLNCGVKPQRLAVCVLCGAFDALLAW
jgi:hypothetical protein